MKLQFYVNGLPVTVETSPLRSLLSILREDLGLSGTKEGCSEGECGACAVHLDGELVKSCMVPACQLWGRSVVTIEGVSAQGPTGLQDAFLEEGAVQCGFCTPGFVMASEYILRNHPSPDEEAIRKGLAGNLCRCTGYASLVRGVQRAVMGGYTPREIPLSPSSSEISREIPQEYRKSLEKEGVFLPRTLEEALIILENSGEELLPVAGGTDILPDMVKKVRKPPEKVMNLRGIAELEKLEYREASGMLEIGAGVTFARIREHPLVKQHLPALHEMAAGVGAVGIQNMATLGGNLMSASAAGDAAPLLLALDAEVVFVSSRGERVLPLKDLYQGYRETVRQASELLYKVRIPSRLFGTPQKFFKVGTRKALTISRLSLGCSVVQEAPGVFSRVRLAVGSVTPWPVLLPKASELLENRPLSTEDVKRAAEILAGEVVPRKDTAYRQSMISNLICRFFAELLEQRVV
jgi:carbon-monoxide dehydrogenase small subunit/xanthine dehydrogenase small subunit